MELNASLLKKIMSGGSFILNDPSEHDVNKKRQVNNQSSSGHSNSSNGAGGTGDTQIGTGLA